MIHLVVVPDNLEKSGLDLLRATEGIELHAPGKMTREQTMEIISRADGLIVRSDTKADPELLAAAANLKCIVRAGVGVDNIDLNACTERGIVVMNAPDANTVSTAEHAFGLILSLARHIPQADASMRGGKWDRKKYMGTELRGKTLGIVGLGRVGRAVSDRAHAFGMTVVAYDPFVPADVALHLGAPLVANLDELFARADFISLHAIVTDQTREVVNAANIAKMKDGVMIVNAARGQLINNADLAAALKSGKVGGAAIDVYDVEPPAADNPILGLENVIYTPHLGASTAEAQEAVGTQAAEEMIKFLLKGETANVKNKAVLDKLKPK
ncbi:MAG TPA: hydroxyacid dehydrogenase [Aggregatilineaceae bacterium]|nr:hydroxyacid dehydrogenase [Aggregatilineaceae bacterium]